MEKLVRRRLRLTIKVANWLKRRAALYDKYFVLENWKVSANHVNRAAGAFFTLNGLGRQLKMEEEQIIREYTRVYIKVPTRNVGGTFSSCAAALRGWAMSCGSR